MTNKSKEQGVYEARNRIGAAIKERREALGLSLRNLSKLCGVSHQNITKIEHGRYNASIDILDKIADALNAQLELKDITKGE